MNKDRALKTVIQRSGLETPPAGMPQLIMQRIAAERQRKARLYDCLSYLWASLGAAAMLVTSVLIFSWNKDWPDTALLFTDYFNTLKSEWASVAQSNGGMNFPTWIYLSLFMGAITFLLLLIDHRMRRYYAQKHKERHYA